MGMPSYPVPSVVPPPSVASASSSSTGGGTGRPWGPPGPRVTLNQRQQDEAPWPPCVRWGPFLPWEVSSKTSRRKALGGHPPFVGYCWPSVTCRGRRVTQAGVTRPANRTWGGCAGSGMRKAVVAAGCCQDPWGYPGRQGVPSDAAQGWVGASSLCHRARQPVCGYEAAAPGPLEEALPVWGWTALVGRAEPTLHQKRGLQENLAGARGHSQQGWNRFGGCAPPLVLQRRVGL